MSNPTSSYKQIVKATSVFGGVQIINILILVLRSKAIALLLGPSGMGIASLFTSTISFISAITNFGLGTSAVKNIASAASSSDQDRLTVTVSVFKKLVWVTGLLGFLVTLIFAPYLSEFAFNNRSYSVAFMIVSVTLLLTQLTSGHNVILQGLRKIQYMAKASMIGAFLGLVVSLPLYYFFKENGIVPAIILSALIALIISHYFSSKVNIRLVPVTKELFLEEGKDMLRMGFLISLSGLIALGGSYLIRIYISSSGDIVDVGLYNAGFAMVGTYVGLIFTSMGTDYFPRLSAVADDNKLCRKEINQQGEISLLILGPILIVFILFIKYAIVLLYSDQFVEVAPMVRWASLGIFFKAISWSIAMVFVAKGDSKKYFYNELIANSYIILFNFVGYYWMGLTGLGISYLIGYAVHLIQMYVVSKKLYSFELNSGLLKIFIIQFVLAVICFLVSFQLHWIWSIAIGTLAFLVSLVFSYREMNRRIDLAITLEKFRKKFRKK